ncbi:MAG: SH3 domain-containing protein [Oscillospiraceae bacterium]|nr:SH3 domain-containing protein [Oscillospiraceae bacterium]
MIKQIASFLLAMVILLGVVLVGTSPVGAESAFTTSDDCIRVLKLEEGFCEKPYWDYAQYTVGYGSRCPTDMIEYYKEHGITEKEAETLLRNHLVAIERDVNNFIDKYGLNLSQNQFDALVMFSYNCGTAWVYDTKGTFHNAIKNGATGNNLIRVFALWCKAGGQVKTFLLRRRLCEANMYLNGIYSKEAPENYCYVLYNANGGTSSLSSQGYDADLTAEPVALPTYEGYVFQGWYTAKTGGTKVEVLDASTKNVTLYAQWLDSEGEAPEDDGPTAENPLTVTVTATDVNLRKGAGTNYSIVGTAQKGQQFAITETAEGTGYIWGQFDGGWIALDYTDYEEALKNQITTPPATEPDETTPEETDPEETEPASTEPAATEPEVTEPPATEPQEPAKVTGTVKVQDYLRVRSGPGTSYAIAGYLKPKQKVEILETKQVGATKWGKITTGWISLDYVILDTPVSDDTNSDKPSTDESVPDSTTPDKNEPLTGTVKVNDLLRVRSGAGTTYSIVGYLKPNAKVTVTEQKTVGSTVWGKIATGWISLDYVKLDSTSSNTTTTQKVTKTVIADCLNVRSAPGTNNRVVNYLYYGAKVEILETKKAADGTLWGKISTGWICMTYVK